MSEIENENNAEIGEPASPETTEAAPSTQDAVNEWKVKYAYLLAEIENMKKRHLKERADLIRFANEEVLKRIITVFDNVELGLKAAEEAASKAEASVKENPAFVNLVKGMGMTLKHFEQTLEQVGVKPLQSLGADFDPNTHEAMGQVQNAGQKDNTVSVELLRGFTLNGRLLRAARVLVNKLS